MDLETEVWRQEQVGDYVSSIPANREVAEHVISMSSDEIRGSVQAWLDGVEAAYIRCHIIDVLAKINFDALYYMENDGTEKPFDNFERQAVEHF